MHRSRHIRRAVIALFAISALLTSSVGAAPRSKGTAPATFAEVAAHPWAQAQPTSTGRQLLDLQAFEGRIYAGYGDYSANTGPITIASFTPGEVSFAAEAVSDTEAIYNYRPVNGQLLAPATDPKIAADFAAGGPWTDRAVVGAWHAFDMATLTGSDLWLVGSHGLDAVAWHSLDGGETWVESLRVPPAMGGGYARFYFAGVLGDRLYVQAHDANTGAQPSSMVFDGLAWTAGPALVSGSEPGWRPVEFNGSLVFHTWGHGFAAAIKKFDGRRTTSISTGYDLTVADGNVYVLGHDGSVRKSADLRRWKTVAQAPASGRSLEVLDGTLYVGTANGELLVATVQ